jgi:alcohol dehydrogenase (cytochrome c)
MGHPTHTPADAWDYDGVNELVLADIIINGEKTPVMMKADRDGFFFVANRVSGKLLSAEPFVPVNWATRYDVANVRPLEDSAKRPRLDYKATDICPSWMGGKNWQPMSFNPETGLIYVTTNNMCQDMQAAAVTYRRGAFYLGDDFKVIPGHGDHLGQLLALDPATQKPAWTVNLPLPWNGGTMTTAGNLVFFGDITGWFHALNAKTGAELWQMNVGSGVGAGPMSFAVNGKQYVAILVGRAESPPAFMGEIGKKIIAATPEGGTLFVFSL